MKYVDSYNILGINTRQIPCITGNGAPTSVTEGKVGCLYMDEDSGEIYKCISEIDGFVWESIDQNIRDYVKNYVDETILGGAW